MTVSFRVPLADTPLDIRGSLALFQRSGDDFVDRWDGARLMRAVYDGAQCWTPFWARATGELVDAAFEVTVASPTSEQTIRDVVANTFMAAPRDYRRLLHEDPVVAGLDARFPGIRQIRQLDVFTALIRCISSQQVNLRWAVTTRRRLAEAFGVRHEIGGEAVYALDPQRLARVEPAEIRALQFTTSKSVSIVATARVIVDGGLRLDDLNRLEDEAIIERLEKIRGIGRWSAEWVLARTLGRPRIVAGDLGVRKAVGLAYLGSAAPSEAEVRAATAHWGESAGVAQALLLHALGEGAFSSMLASPARRRPPAASRA
ncbi:MAG: DNA-3-methyladenine glycosylase 2 family protein [Chloroflexi bacterium]|nr:DNA-3-methyladenine glycosylase 2 family protein [Chloroflexota bacterium]